MYKILIASLLLAAAIAAAVFAAPPAAGEAVAPTVVETVETVDMRSAWLSDNGYAVVGRHFIPAVTWVKTPVAGGFVFVAEIGGETVLSAHGGQYGGIIPFGGEDAGVALSVAEVQELGVTKFLGCNPSLVAARYGVTAYGQSHSGVLGYAWNASSFTYPEESGEGFWMIYVQAQ